MSSTTCIGRHWSAHEATEQTRREDIIHRLPYEAALFTRVLTLKKSRPNASATLCIEMNSSGYGVVPVIDEGTTKVQFGTKRMSESKCTNGRVVTTFVEKEVVDSGNGHYRVVAHAIYFNGFQDQTMRLDNDGNPLPVDWWAKRLARGTHAADFAIGVPSQREIEILDKRQRGEASDWTRAQSLEHRPVPDAPNAAVNNSNNARSRMVCVDVCRWTRAGRR